MLDLFSSFDYMCTKLNFWNSCLIWLMSVVWMVFLLGGYSFVYSFWSVFLKNFGWSHWLNVKTDTTKKFNGFYCFVFVVMVLVVMSNLWGIVFLIFGGSAQMVYSLSLSFLFWSSVVLSNLVYNVKSFVGHLSPLGAPVVLLVLLNKVEFLSMLIRVFTLSLRLSINMSTGHMFLNLLGFSSLCSLLASSYLSGALCFITIVLYSFFELAICVLQGYVFSLLLVQYMDEHSMN